MAYPCDIVLHTLRRAKCLRGRLHNRLGLCFALSVTLSSAPVLAVPWDLELTPQDLKRVADGMLTLTAFTVIPDVTTSSLSIENAESNNPGLLQTTLGGGFTVSHDLPLYLEGNLGWSRFDPSFIATDGQQQRRVPFKWNALSATGGVGWDWAIDAREELRIRPIFNFVLGRITSDANIITSIPEGDIDPSLSQVDDLKMNVYGLGGSLMLDYERYRESYEFDTELRYTNIQLRSIGDTSPELEGKLRD